MSSVENQQGIQGLEYPLWKEKHREPGLFSLGKRWLWGPSMQSVPTQELPEKTEQSSWQWCLLRESKKFLLGLG